MVVLIGSSLPPFEITPPGSVMLFSRSACEIWNSDTPFSDAFSRSTDTSALRSTPPETSTPKTPSTADISGTIRDSTMRCSSATSPPLMTLSCSTGNSSGLMRATIGSLTPPGNEIPPTFELMTFSALDMSVPNSNEARMIDRFSVEIDCIASRPSTPVMAASMGSVTSRTTASGLADG